MAAAATAKQKKRIKGTKIGLRRGEGRGGKGRGRKDQLSESDRPTDPPASERASDHPVRPPARLLAANEDELLLPH